MENSKTTFSRLKHSYACIAAVAKNGCIGGDNKLLWKLSDDLKHFKQLTQHSIVIMGRKTFESIGFNPLPNRLNIVVSRSASYAENMNIMFNLDVAEGRILFVDSIENAITICENNDFKSTFVQFDNSVVQVFFIGGGEIYKQCLSYCKFAYITKVYEDVDGDTFFPTNELNSWIEVAEDYTTHAGLYNNNTVFYKFKTFKNPGMLTNTESIKEKINALSVYPPLGHTGFEANYAWMLAEILNNGCIDSDRTGTGTIRMQHAYFKQKIDIFPALRGKKVSPRNALIEMLWILRGDTNTKFLKDHGVNYWDEWADENGDLGPIYGHQMRNFNSLNIDQLQNAIDTIRTTPNSRRIIIDLWNPAQLKEMALPPCHIWYQFCVYPQGNKQMLDLHIVQRSGDMFLGIGYDFMLFNILARVVAYLTGLTPGYVHHTINDAHIYLNHIDQVAQYLKTVAQDKEGKITGITKMRFNDRTLMLGTDFKHINDWLTWAASKDYNIAEFENYDSYPAIKAPVAV